MKPKIISFHFCQSNSLAWGSNYIMKKKKKKYCTIKMRKCILEVLTLSCADNQMNLALHSCTMTLNQACTVSEEQAANKKWH